MGTFPSYLRDLGERPKHWSPLIQIGFIKHSLGLWDGWCVGWVLTGSYGEKLSCLQVILAPINGPAMETFNEEALLGSWGLNSVLFCFFWIFQKFPLIEEETWISVHDGIAVKMRKRKVSVLARTLEVTTLSSFSFFCKSYNTHLTGWSY